MALTVGMALFGSLLLALLFIPAAATFLFRGGAPESMCRNGDRQQHCGDGGTSQDWTSHKHSHG